MLRLQIAMLRLQIAMLRLQIAMLRYGYTYRSSIQLRYGYTRWMLPCECIASVGPVGAHSYLGAHGPQACPPQVRRLA
jgi:hypothetical protein